MTATPSHKRLIFSTISSTILGLLTATITYTATPVQAAPLSFVASEQTQALIDTFGPGPEAYIPLQNALQAPICDENTDVRCNCYLYMKSLFPSLPRTADLKPNTTPNIGTVVIFDYPHFGKIVGLDHEGFWLDDTNWGGPGYRTHFMLWTNPHIKGFWKP